MPNPIAPSLHHNLCRQPISHIAILDKLDILTACVIYICVCVRVNFHCLEILPSAAHGFSSRARSVHHPRARLAKERASCLSDDRGDA